MIAIFVWCCCEVMKVCYAQNYTTTILFHFFTISSLLTADCATVLIPSYTIPFFLLWHSHTTDASLAYHLEGSQAIPYNVCTTFWLKTSDPLLKDQKSMQNTYGLLFRSESSYLIKGIKLL
jgi:hypothetical protein